MHQHTNNSNTHTASSEPSARSDRPSQVQAAPSPGYKTPMTASHLVHMQKTIGNRAVVQRLQSHMQERNSSIVQRRILPYKTQNRQVDLQNAYGNQVQAIVNEINQRVLNARAQALQWTAFQGSPVAHLSQWYDSASGYAADPEGSHDLIHARFGYAIETLACHGLGDQQGLRVQLQVVHGHTRPDIVISSDQDGEIAWIDITSEQSEGHIKSKAGSGWNQKPFVFEVLYDPLTLQEILEGANDSFYSEYGEFLVGEQRIEAEEKAKKETEWKGKFDGFLKRNDWKTGYGGGLDKQKKTKDFFMQESQENDQWNNYKNKMQMTRGALNYLGINDGPFGFNIGDVGQDRAAIKAIIDVQASDDIHSRKRELAGNKNREIAEALQGYEDAPAVRDYMHRVLADQGDREVAKTGMALKHAIGEYEGLNQFVDQVELDFNPDDGRVQALIQETAGIMDQFPQRAAFAPIQTWRNLVKDLHKYRALLYRITTAQREFIDYVNVKYPAQRPQEVELILQELDKKPQDDSVIGVADQWMIDNPVPVPIVQDDGPQSMEIE